MAVDTAQKRADAAQLLHAFYGPIIIPDASLTQPDRQSAANVYSGISASAVATSSGVQRLAQHAKPKQQKYRSIDWSSPVFGETAKQEQVKTEPEKERAEVPSKTKIAPYSQKELSDVDREIQLLMREAIAMDGSIDELKAIDEKIQEASAHELRMAAEKRHRRKLGIFLIMMSAA